MKMQDKFDLIMSRQARFEWGTTYIPSTLAVPREAPRGSRVSRLHSQKLNRTLHALSTPEKVFTQLALHHPNLFDLHEQKMLWPIDAPHPLHGHPLTKGSYLRSLRGTLSIAEEIGFKHFSFIKCDREVYERVAFPYQGDLLLYLKDDQGVPFAVNWTVKDKAAAFRERRASSPKTPVQQKRDRDHALLRGRLEHLYYASAGIRTVQVSKDQIPAVIEANLDLLFNMHDLPLSLEPSLLEDFSSAALEAVRAGAPLNYLAIKYAARWGSLNQFITRVYQDIWNRRITVDFNYPILIDHPLNIDGPSLIELFDNLFEEGQK